MNACAYPSNTPQTGYKYGCRCERCKGAISRQNRSRRAAKRRNARENRPYCRCGRQMNRYARECSECWERTVAANRELIEALWAEGASARFIGAVTGWANPATNICRMRARGWNLPYRHEASPEGKAAQVASMLRNRQAG